MAAAFACADAAARGAAELGVPVEVAVLLGVRALPVHTRLGRGDAARVSWTLAHPPGLGGSVE